MSFKCKITMQDVTFGPNTKRVSSTVAKFVANSLLSSGYRRTSNAYSMVSRIDRPDWLEVVANDLGCAVADLYDRNGLASWQDYYIRVHSKDNHTIHPDVFRYIWAYR